MVLKKGTFGNAAKPVTLTKLFDDNQIHFSSRDVSSVFAFTASSFRSLSKMEAN